MKEEFKVDTSDVNENLSEHYMHEQVEQKKHTFANTIIIILILIVGVGFFVVDKYNVDIIEMMGLKKTESAIDNRKYKEDEELAKKFTSTTTSTTTTSTTTSTTTITTTSTTTRISTTINSYNNN